MLPRIAPFLSLALACVTVVLEAAPLKVTVVADDPAAVKSLVA